MSRPLLVVAQVHGFPPAWNAGAEHMLAPMLAALVARGHRAEVRLTQYIAGVRDHWNLDGVHVMPPDTVAPGPRPDVYVTHLENVRPCSALARGQGVPLVVLQHNTHQLSLDELALADPALVVLNSQWMRQRLAYVERAIVVRPPVIAERYETTPGDMVTQVSLTPGKGGGLFWEVAERMPDTEFLAVHGSYGVPVMPDRVPENVTVLDCMDGRDMRDEVYAKTRILMVPSEYESWGRVATEAMCSGIPVIANRAEGGLAENLGKAGIWAGREHPDEWVTEIRRLAKPAAYAKASEAARKRAAELDPAADLERWCTAIEGLAP